MPTILLIVYRVLGTVLFVLAAAAIVEKYRTVRGAALLPARVLECRRASSTSNSRGAGATAIWWSCTPTVGGWSWRRTTPLVQARQGQG